MDQAAATASAREWLEPNIVVPEHSIVSSFCSECWAETVKLNLFGAVKRISSGWKPVYCIILSHPPAIIVVVGACEKRKFGFCLDSCRDLSCIQAGVLPWVLQSNFVLVGVGESNEWWRRSLNLDCKHLYCRGVGCILNKISSSIKPQQSGLLAPDPQELCGNVRACRVPSRELIDSASWKSIEWKRSDAASWEEEFVMLMWLVAAKFLLHLRSCNAIKSQAYMPLFPKLWKTSWQITLRIFALLVII